MTENYSRKVTLIVVLIVAAIASMVVPTLRGEPPFRLGLDLRGGTRLVYAFDFDEALRRGVINENEYASKTDMLHTFSEIIRGRVDPNGVMELSLRPEGENRIVIELPGAAELATSETVGRLATPIAAGDVVLTLEASDPAVQKAFPPSGGVIRVGSEKIVYAERRGAELHGLSRGSESTPIADHPAGTDVRLLSSDDLQRRIENVGDLQFLLSATTEDLSKLGTDMTREQQKVDAWRKAHPGEPLDNFNRLPSDQGGPVAGLRWYTHRIGKDQEEVPLAERPARPLIASPEPWVFSGDDLERVEFSADDTGYPAVAFEFKPEKKTAFGDFTAAHVEDGMAIVLNGEIATIATIRGKLPGGGQISGGAAGFTPKEVQDLITVLRSGSLRIKPQLLERARVGASLGDDYVTKSLYSSLAALGVVMTFMLVFYRRLGLFSVIGLAINLLLLMGALAFLRATLTLPGVAGIILTLGMAVDGNILIYERLREELNRGLKLIQAARAAFERAGVTIIDSNLTTLIAGVILYYAGTGPIRGFATTLNLGILSTLFTVIVVTEVLVLIDIKRGRPAYKMMKMLENPGIPFMKGARIAIPISILVLVATVGLWISLPMHEKLGIDFLGGFSMTVRTEEPQKIGTMRELVAQIPGTIGRSAEVKEILDSGDKATGYRMFRITHKLEEEAETTSASAAAETNEREIREALATVLAKEPVQLAVTPAGDNATVTGSIHLEAEHPIPDLSAALAAAGLRNAEIQPVAGESGRYTVKAETAAGRDAGDLAAAVRAQLEGHKDAKGAVYSLYSPVSDSVLVGASVGSELRDKAVLAVLLSLLGTILYVRVRFAEYGYGIAVVVSLAHDVLFALGALGIGIVTGLVQAELDLAMIAAFLTIIGFSQNDTIVIFDRVRENRPKSKKPLSEVLNDSINECLGRTILTSLTVLLTLSVLFAFNVGSRNVLEGFAFAMICGVISGVYSTIYVASPVLLWFENRAQRKNGSGGGDTAPKSGKEERLAVS